VVAVESATLVLVGLGLAARSVGPNMGGFGFILVLAGAPLAVVGAFGAWVAHRAWRGHTGPLLAWGLGAILVGLIALQGYANRPEPYVVGHETVEDTSQCVFFENVGGKPVCREYLMVDTDVPVYERSEGGLYLSAVVLFPTAAVCVTAFALNRRRAGGSGPSTGDQERPSSS
jgi:hypothetical protein